MSDNIALNVKNVTISYQNVNTFRLKGIGSHFKTKKINRFIAVDDVSFSVKEGSILGIIGRNGSGKSTLLRAIAGIYSPDSGCIDLKNNKASLLALGVGFQTALSGYENIYLSGLLQGFSIKEIDKKVDEIIDFAELGDFIYKPVNTYSSGMNSKLAFSISIILDADIILIDEVLSVGDVHFREKSFNKIREILTDRSKTVILVSHSEGIIQNECDEVFWLHDGKIVHKGLPEETIEAYLKFMKK